MRLSSTQLQKGLVGWWKMDEPVAIHGSKVVDSSGFGNHGTLSTGDGTVNKAVAGKLGKGLSFDGSNDVVLINNNVSANVLHGDFSVCEWFFPKNMAGVPGSIINIVGDNATMDMELPYDSKLGRTWFIELYDGTNPYIYGRDEFLDNTWYFIGITKTSDVGILLYKNSVLIPFNYPVNSNIMNANTIISIGGWANGQYPFNGIIDDVRIYNRALSAGEVRGLFENTQRITSPLIVPSNKVGLIDSGLVGREGILV